MKCLLTTKSQTSRGFDIDGACPLASVSETRVLFSVGRVEDLDPPPQSGATAASLRRGTCTNSTRRSPGAVI